jgi:hypothetical protein
MSILEDSRSRVPDKSRVDCVPKKIIGPAESSAEL